MQTNSCLAVLASAGARASCAKQFNDVCNPEVCGKQTVMFFHLTYGRSMCAVLQVKPRSVCTSLL